MPTLTARTLITDIGTIAYPAIEVDQAGVITDISSDTSMQIASIQNDRILTPAFFDIHFHGAAGQDVMHATPQGFTAIQRFLASKGTAHYLPTTVTATVDETLRSLESIADAIERPTPEGEATPLGVHLEGPFLSHARRGVHAADLLQRPSIDLFERFQQAARGHILLLTIAPETEGALDLIRHAVSLGVRVSAGHTNATAVETRGAVAAGTRSATHLFNAMRPLDHREPGVVGVYLDDDSLFAELICDGVHVAPEVVRLWLRIKRDHAILVTDAMSATGMPDGAYELAHLPVTLSDGRCFLTGQPETLAGSVLTLDRAVANLQRFTGCALEEAVRCASSHPAALLGVSGSLASPRAGQFAHFNQYTPDNRLEATYLHGRKIESS